MKTYKVEEYDGCCGYKVFIPNSDNYQIIAQHYGCHSYYLGVGFESNSFISLQIFFYNSLDPQGEIVKEFQMKGNYI